MSFCRGRTSQRRSGDSDHDCRAPRPDSRPPPDDGFNLRALEAEGLLTIESAEELLSTFVFDGILDELRFKTIETHRVYAPTNYSAYAALTPYPASDRI